ncbi:MAG: LCP family protein [Acidimicrobiia bacterium]
MSSRASVSRRSWPQRLLIAFNVGLIAAFLAGAGGLGYFRWRFDRIPRIDAAVEATEEALGPQNFLLVGSDTRAAVEPDSEDEDGFGGVEASDGSGHSDVVMLVRVDPRVDQAWMLSFPRDLWVEIPGKGPNRINVAFRGDADAGVSGADLLIATLRQNFGIPVNHFAQVDFFGFEDLVDAIGGVTIHLPGPVRDLDTSVSPAVNVSGLDIGSAGCVELNGEQALQYVRSRHFQTQRPDGTWVADRTSDLGRITRQQDFIRRAVDKVVGPGVLNPLKLNELVGVAERSVVLSASIEIDDLLDLAEGYRSLTSGGPAQFAIPTVAVTRPRTGAQVLELDPSKGAELEAILDVFRGVERVPAGSVGPAGTDPGPEGPLLPSTTTTPSPVGSPQADC